MGGRPRAAGTVGLAAGAGAGGGVTKPAGVTYNCSQPGCTKTFTRRSNLRAHARIHSGLEPYVCLEPACCTFFFAGGGEGTGGPGEGGLCGFV